jgi:hypothetical protein
MKFISKDKGRISLDRPPDLGLIDLAFMSAQIRILFEAEVPQAPVISAQINTQWKANRC